MKADILSYIYDKSPTQRKKIVAMFLEVPQIEDDLESFLSIYSQYMKEYNISYQELCENYLLMNNQMLHARIHFLREGTYPISDANEATLSVYNNHELMRKYMLGLALSQFLWEHHYLVFNFFKKNIPIVSKENNILEIGSGHGLLLMEIINNTECKNIDVVDISETSLKISEDIVKKLLPSQSKSIKFYCKDIFSFEPKKTYKFIVMGEVLEHVEQPLALLKKLYSLIAEDGIIFISTCANCPAIDHVYMFNNTSEIENMIIDSGLRVVKSLEVCSEKAKKDKNAQYKPDIMYAAFLTKGA